MLEGYMLIAEIEGMSIEEAKLTYAERKDLPSSAFCGPDRSYPAHDAKHVRAGLQRLSQFWKKISPTVRMKIYRCLLRRAKRFGVEVDKEKFEESVGEIIPEEKMNREAVTNWYLEQIGLR
jgi:hypothetical protein